MMLASDIAKEAKYTRLSNGDLEVEGAGIIFKNFSGAPTEFNPAGGKRTFALVLPRELADDLAEEGWNIRRRPAKDEGDEDMLYTEIVVNMNSMYPPKLHLLFRYGDSEKMRLLHEDELFELDENIITDIDLIVHPFAHGRSNSAGSTVKGYLKTLYATQVPAVDFGGKYSKYMVEK